MDAFLLFTQHFDRDPGQDYGRLSINGLSDGTTHIWKATSSHATKQHAESFHERGGLLPPQYRVPNLKNYTVNTTPIDLRHNKGVAGNFYQISPFAVLEQTAVNSVIAPHEKYRIQQLTEKSTAVLEQVESDIEQSTDKLILLEEEL